MKGARPAVCVAGSLMVDIVMRAPRRPLPGETIFADGCGVFLGGKGFNQAVAARRMGADVAMIGRLGDDEFASRFRAALASEGIDGSAVRADVRAGTGIALPLVEPDGSNSIIVAPRANMQVSPDDIAAAAPIIRAADVLTLQLEIPPEASETAARIARASGGRVLLNPAPARPLPPSLLRAADILTPNEVEAAHLAGIPITDVESAFAAAERLRDQGPEAVVITLGAMGAVAVGPGLRIHLPAHPVAVVDSTAAGDAFTGALGCLLAEGADLPTALSWANAAGARAVARLGAEPSLPRRDDVSRLLPTVPPRLPDMGS